MASIRLGGATRAALLAFVFSTAATSAQAQPGQLRSPAATLWQLRSGLNVAALACRGPGEAAIVAGYNRLLSDHRAELAGAYSAVAREYGSGAAFDRAMTRVYNSYAQPASQAALCANALGVLDTLAARGRAPLGDLAGAALSQLEGDDGDFGPQTQVAVASIPQVLDQRGRDYEDGVPDDE